MDQSAQGSADIKKALQETVKLNDGRHGFIFTELPPIGLLSRWHCHICGRTISSERSLLMHLTHPVHTSNLRAPQHPAAHFKKFVSKSGANQDAKDSSWSNTDVVPGEPVPPGMEDSIETCHIQEAFDSYKGPLIGLEYIVELVNLEDQSEPRYICLLCEKRGDPRSVMVHVTSQNHFLKYISCFFRTVGNILNLTKVVPENKKGYSIAVRKIAAEIEKHYGRLKPTSAAAETFSQKKYEILKAIDEKEHFRETPSTTFVHLATPEMIAKFNDEEEDELLKPIVKPLEELKTQSSRGAFDKQMNEKRDWISRMVKDRNDKKPTDRSDHTRPARDRTPDKKLSFQIGEPKRSLGTNLASESDAKDKSKKDPEVVVIEDDRDSKSLSPISSSGSVGGRGRRRRISRERSRSLSRDRMRRGRERDRDRDRRSPGGIRRMRSRSRTRSPRRDSRSHRESPRRAPIDRRRDRRDFSPDRRPRDLTPDRRGRDYTPDRRSPDRRGRERALDDRRRRDLTADRYDRRRRDSRDRSPYRERDSNHERRRSPPHHRSSERRDDKKRKWDDYRAELSKLELEAEKKLKMYESRPEKHPLYNEEWKAFWNKRYKEVQADGRDPNTYDFKPEWIVYWGRRMKEINEEEFRLRSADLKIQFNVSMDDVKGPSTDLVDISPPTSEDGKEVTIEDIRNTWKGLTGAELSGPPSSAHPPKRRSPSPWEPEPPVHHPMGPIFAPPPREEMNRGYEVAPPIIHCLRLLSVIEHHLGSLGPRVLELLSKGLALERQGRSKSMTLLEEPEVHVFFDTVKEKIRGALMAYIIERHLVNHCRSLINIVDKMLRNHPPKENPSVPAGDLFKPIISGPKTVIAPVIAPASAPLTVPGIGIIDKMAIAQQIAGALIAQGRTDVSQEELEALINAVVGIAQASNVSVNQNTTSVSFFSQLNMKNSTANSHINSILSSMIKDVTGNAPSMPEPPVEVKPEQPSKDALEEELKEKLIKFNSLSRDEQQSLISILKELEKTDPKKVENLRKYVSVGLTKKDEPSQQEEVPVKKPASKPEVMKRSFEPISDEDDDDDDYSYEDVYKAASEKLKTETNKKLTTRSSVEVNSDSNLSRASASNPPASVVTETPRSDFSNVFGPQRNPEVQTPEPAAPAIKFDPKNSAPDVSDPNSQMSLEEVDDENSAAQEPARPEVSIAGLSAAESKGIIENFNFNSLQNMEIPGNLLNFDTRASYMKEPDPRPVGNFGGPDNFRNDAGYKAPPQFSGMGGNPRGPMPEQNFGREILPPGDSFDRDKGPPGRAYGRDNGPPGNLYGREKGSPVDLYREIGPPGNSFGRDNGPPGNAYGRDNGPPGDAYGRDNGPPGNAYGRDNGPPGNSYGRDNGPPGNLYGRDQRPPSDFGRDQGPPGGNSRDPGFSQFGNNAFGGGGPPLPPSGSFNGGPGYNSGPPQFGGPNYAPRPSFPGHQDPNARNRYFPRNY